MYIRPSLSCSWFCLFLEKLSPPANVTVDYNGSHHVIRWDNPQMRFDLLRSSLCYEVDLQVAVSAGGCAEGSSLSPVWSYIITNGICGPLHSVALLSPGPALRPQSAVCYFLIKLNDFSLFSFLSFWCVGLETTWRGPRGGHSRTLV